jgi:hypothetical protein
MRSHAVRVQPSELLNADDPQCCVAPSQQILSPSPTRPTLIPSRSFGGTARAGCRGERERRFPSCWLHQLVLEAACIQTEKEPLFESRPDPAPVRPVSSSLSAHAPRRVTQAQRALRPLRAPHTPEQRPDGPRPRHVPLAAKCRKRPVLMAVRGPATAFKLAWPERETRPPSRIG